MLLPFFCVFVFFSLFLLLLSRIETISNRCWSVVVHHAIIQMGSIQFYKMILSKTLGIRKLSTILCSMYFLCQQVLIHDHSHKHINILWILGLWRFLLEFFLKHAKFTHKKSIKSITSLCSMLITPGIFKFFFFCSAVTIINYQGYELKYETSLRTVIGTRMICKSIN